MTHFVLDFSPDLWFNIGMLDQMMPTIEETISPDMEAQIEHQEWERDVERRERWAVHEAVCGPLAASEEWFSEGTMK